MASKKPAVKTSTQARSEGQKRRKANEAAELIARRWAMAKAKFENDPVATFASIARDLGVSRQAVQSKGRDWQKKPLSAAQLAEAAHVAADQRPPPPLEVDAALAAVAKIPEHPTRQRQDPKNDPLPPVPPTPDYGADAQALAIQTRADVLSRHRNEPRILRGLMQEALKGRDYAKAKFAKLMGEAMQIVHNIERKAYGLDQPEATPPGGQATVVVRVEREGSPPPAVQVERGEV